MLQGETHVATVKAVYEDGVLKPKEPLDLPEHSEVVVTYVPANSPAEDDDPTGWKAMRQLIGMWKDAPADDLAEEHDKYLYGPER
jgi:predicted DNA-binding antitoxin AbrB/MazE fold protein